MGQNVATADSAEGSSGGWVLVVVLLGLLAWRMPAYVAAAAIATAAAAAWWWSQSQTRKSNVASQAKEEEEERVDEDLGLPQPSLHLQSGAASRKASVREPTRQTPRSSAAKTASNTVSASSALPKATAASTASAQQVSAPNHVLSATNGSDPKTAAATAPSRAAVPAVDLAKVNNAPAVAPTKPAVAPSLPPVQATAADPTSVAAQPAGIESTPVAKSAPATSVPEPVALTGSAAILAKLRSQRQTSRPTSADKKQDSSPNTTSAKVTVLYASQTGTGQEIARTIHAECSAKGMPAEVMSFNELGFDNLTAARTPVVVFVASSTGDGDPPDNAAAAYVALKKPWPKDQLAGVKFTVLGLGDSNYTRFMHVPRAVKNRFLELGATCFYDCIEADEVDGLEDKVDPWCENLYTPLQQILHKIQEPSQQPAAPEANGAATAHDMDAATVKSATASQQSTPLVSEARQPDGVVHAEPSMIGAEASMLGAEQSVLGAELLASVHRDGGDAGTPAAGAAEFGTPRVQMELSAVSENASELSGGASLLGEESSSISQAPGGGAAAPKQPPATASRASSAASKMSTATPVQLVNGLAPADVDLKGVPALAPCRVVINQQVSAAVAEEARSRQDGLPTHEQRAYRDAAGQYSAEQPYWASISTARSLTAEWSDRTVIHLELDVSSSGMKYGPGDAVGVLPQNAASLVSGLLQRLGLDGDAVFEVQPASDDAGSQRLLSHIPWPCTLRYAFTNCTDLTSVPRKSLLRMLAEHCSDADEQRTLLFFTSRAGKDAYAEEISAGQPSLLDLLRRFPSCNPPIDALLDALPPLAPRMYSLTCAPVALGSAGVAVPGACGPDKLQFALSVVDFKTRYGTKRGVASNWLAKLCKPWLSGDDDVPEVLVPIFLRPTTYFRPPASLATPIIMIGPGTGVAPFRGFLQQRLADMQASGETNPATAVLYFGCRQPDEDYIYEQDWAQLQSAGALQKFRVAFSRAQEDKVYVQHLMKEDAQELAQLISAGAHVYVCGDGAAMAKDVHAALVEILRDALSMSDAQAAEELASMTKAGRYVRDIWS